MYAGHGSSNGTIYFGYPHNGVCNNVIQTNSRLGAMGGSQAAVGMWLECEVLSDLIDVVNTQNLWQDLGWGNDISIGDNEPRDVYLATSSMTNRDAWFNTMAGGGRSPTVVSYSSSSTSDCWNNQYSAALRRSILTTPRWTGPMCLQGEPTFYYCFEFVSP